MKDFYSALRRLSRCREGFKANLLLFICVGVASLPASAQMFTRVNSELRFRQTDAGAIVWFDYDNDGWADVFISGGWNNGYGNRLFHNNQDGTFTQVGETNFAGKGAHTGSATVADFNDDGYLDIIAGNALVNNPDENPLLYLNQGKGVFRKLVLDRSALWGGMDVRATTVTALDYNGDGFLDLALGRYDLPTKSFLLKNTGGALFSAVTNTGWTPGSQSYETISSADYDGDGMLELLGAGASRPIPFQNAGARVFELETNSLLYTFQVGYTPLSAAWGDYDNDGDLDVAVTYVSTAPKGLQVFLNDGRGNFTLGLSVTGTCQYVNCADYDNDGKLDLYITGFNSRSRLYRNLGGGSFTEVLNEPIVQDIFAQWPMAGWGDYNNDGFLDLLVAASGSYNALYRNSTNGNHWLKVKLNSLVSNRSAIGATVRVKALIGGQEVWQMRTVQAQSSFTEIVPHFGLGDATKADVVRIEWPSGNVVETLNSVVDRQISLGEPGLITPLRPMANLGGSITLTTTQVGSSYQWRLNDTDLVGQTNRTLTLANLAAADDGRYSVVVSTRNTSVTNFTYLHVDTTFTKITHGPIAADVEPSGGSAWGDYDGDGLIDLFVPNSSTGMYPNSLYRNVGGDEFIRVTNALTAAVGQTWGAQWADVDNDGDLDMFILRPISTVGSQVRNDMFRNDGGGVFTRMTNAITTTAGFWTDAAWVDHNRDGRLDLFLTTQSLASNQSLDDYFFENLGDGSVTTWTTNEVGVVLMPNASTAGPAWCDIDGDGDLDLYVSKYAGTGNFLYRNDGGKLIPVTAGSLPAKRSTWGAVWADFNNDGLFDLFTGGENGTNMLHLNRGNWVFEDVTVASGLALAGTVYTASAGDFDNDGDLDLYVSVYDGPDVLYLNRGDATFVRMNVGPLLTDGFHNGAVWVDYNNDGFLDLFQACGDATPSRNFLYRNSLPQYGNANHWLKLILKGTTSNASAIGARVWARAVIAGKVVSQVRQVTTACLAAQSTDGMRPHFGLGDATNVVSLRIEWPSGTVQQLNNVAADQILTVVEPRRPVLSVSLANGGTIDGSLRADPGRIYEVQFSEDLVTWTALSSVTSNAQGFGTWTDPGAAESPRRFYRALLIGP